MIRIYPDLKKSSEVAVEGDEGGGCVVAGGAGCRVEEKRGDAQQLHLFPLPYAYSSFSSLSELARVGDPSSIGYDGVAN